MRWAEYALFLVLSIGASLFAAGIIRERWSSHVKRFFRFGVPVLIFLTLSFVFVATGERVEDIIAKDLFCWAYNFEACRKQTFTEAVPGVPGPPEMLPVNHSPAEFFELGTVNSIPPTKENCIEAGKQADRYFHADNRVRMHELLEISLTLCSRVPIKDQQVKERLAGSYVALGEVVPPYGTEWRLG